MTSCRTESDGDSLGECTTNVFVLADARGLRWKKFAASYCSASTIPEDPILCAYAKALSLDLLCVWQRSTTFGQQVKEEPGANRLLDCPKELVLFWYGEEPVVNGVFGTLKEVSTGSFDSGFSTEYHNLLYKALHNLIERHLQSNGFVRMGKWYMRPVEANTGKRESPAFSFSFFIYGESLVATSVDIDKRPSIRRLDKDDVTSANSCTGLPTVYLAPYGLKAVLTGNSLPHCDAQASKLISDWNRFFMLGCTVPEEQTGGTKELVPPIVEVAVKDTRMLFPSKLVLIPLSTKEEGKGCFNNIDKKPKLERNGTLEYSDTTRNQTNPCDSVCGKIWHQLATKKDATKTTAGAVKTEGQSSSTSSTTLWDFREALRHTACGCTSSSNVTRTKPMKKFIPGSNASRGTFSPTDYSPKGSSPLTPHGAPVQSNQKKREQKRPTAFHQRSCHLSDRSHTPPLLPVIPGSRALHSQNSVPCYNNMSLAKDNTGTKGNTSYSVIGPKTLDGQGYTSCIEKLKTKEVSSTSFHTKLAQVKPQVNASNYLDRKDLYLSSYQNTKSHYCLPTTTHCLPPHLKEDPLQATRLSEDFSIYTPQDQSLSQRLGNVMDVLSPENSATLSPAASDTEKSKSRMKRSLSTENHDNGARKVKRESLSGTENPDLLLVDSAYRTEQSSHSQASEKKVRGHGRGRGRRESNTQSPRSEIASPGSDVFDDEAEILSPGTGSKKRYVNSSRSRDSLGILSSPPHSTGTSTRSGTSRTKKRSNGTGRKAPARQEMNYESKESSNSLINPPPNVILPHNNKNVPLPSPKSTNFSSITPRHSVSSRLLNIKDLQVSENDLDMLFEWDEEDTPKFKTLAHPDNIGHAEDSSKNVFAHNPVTSAGLTQQDLAQMFPTPPSQEPQVHAPSPATPGQVEYMTGCIQQGTILSPEKIIPQIEREVPEQKVDFSVQKQTLAPAFQLPRCASHPTGNLFSPIKDLPSFMFPASACEIPVYKPSSGFKYQMLDINTNVVPPLRIKTPPDLAPSSLNVSPGIVCPNTFSGVSTSVLPGAAIMRSQLPTPTEIPPLTPSPLIKTLRPEFPMPPTLGSYDMDSQSLRMTLLLSDSIVNCFGTKQLESPDINIWLSEIDSDLWTHSGSNDSQASTWPLFYDDAALPESCGRLKLTQYPHCFQKRPSTLPLHDTCFIKTDKEKGKNEINQAFLKVVCDQWSSPFSAQYLENLISKVYSPVTACTQADYSDSYLLEILQDLRPKLQEALQKPLRRCSWEPVKVEGPSAFHLLHKFASKIGIQGNFAVQPLLISHDGDWMSLSPYALRYWEKLLLEPFGGRRDVAYIAVAPDSETVLENTKWFFKELSSLYESLNLGQHSPITRTLREGILRINEAMMQKLAQETVDDWFLQGEGPDIVKMKLVAQACKGYLGPHLTFVSGKLTSEKNSITSDHLKGGGPMSPLGVGAHPSAAEEAILEEEKESTPAIVIYMVDPFQEQTISSQSPLWSLAGLLRSFAEMVHNLPAQLKENVFIQVVPLDLILRVRFGVASGSTTSLRPRDLRQLAISVYSQCRAPPKLLSTAKALTGFGNAVVRENLVFKRQNDNQLPGRVYLPPCVLASPPSLISEDVHSLNGFDRALKTQDTNILFCGYCLSSDQHWIFVVCSDRSGEITETCIIRLNSDGRTKKGTNSRQSALRRIWDFVYNIISFATNPWRVVFTRFGKPGKGELQDFAVLIRKVMKKKTNARQRHQEPCRACNSVNGRDDYPNIRSVSYTTIDTETGIRLLLRTKKSKSNVARSRVYIVPPLQSAQSQPAMQPTSRRTPVTWADRNDDEYLPDPASLILASGEDDCPDSDFLPLLTSPSDPNNLVYNSNIISPSSEIQETLLTAASESGQVQRLNASRLRTSTSPFQPILQKSAGFGSPLTIKSSPGATPTSQLSTEENELSIDQPLAVGYLLSSCGERGQEKSCENRSFVVRSELRLHFTGEDAQPRLHHLDGNNNLEILRYLMEQMDALSWLTVDPSTGERRSQLAVHMYLLRGLSMYFQRLFS